MEDYPKLTGGLIGYFGYGHDPSGGKEINKCTRE